MKVSNCMSTVMGSATEIVIKKISMGKDDAQSLLTGCSGPVSLCITGCGFLQELLTTLPKLMFGKETWGKKRRTTSSSFIQSITQLLWVAHYISHLVGCAVARGSEAERDHCVSLLLLTMQQYPWTRNPSQRALK